MKRVLAAAVLALTALTSLTAAEAPELVVDGHRGYFSQYPENTLPSFAAAVKLGLKRIEYDVQRTKDGVLVIRHDDLIRRDPAAAAANFRISEHTLAEVKELDVGRYKGEAFAGTRVPTLEETVAFFRAEAPQVEQFVELKGTCRDMAAVDEIVALFRRNGLDGQLYILCFDIKLLQRVHERYPGLKLQGLLSRELPEDIYERCAGFTNIGLMHKLVTPEVVKAFHDRGIKVETWCVDNPELLARMIACGVDSVTTNEPEIILEALRKPAEKK